MAILLVSTVSPREVVRGLAVNRGRSMIFTLSSRSSSAKQVSFY